MAVKIGVPKRDGSGQGTRRNAGRGGHTPRRTGLGRTTVPSGRRRNTK